jgi:hypothetical protein
VKLVLEVMPVPQTHASREGIGIAAFATKADKLVNNVQGRG